MGTRIKTFDSTGIAPGGRLYAGDLNALQDQYADLSNFSQNHGVGSLGIGESGLQLLRYAAGEARLTGAMRVDGILRGLGGLYAGAFTTTQRNAIAAGKAPFGLVLLNSTLNRYEWNRGTDGSRDWQPMQPDTFPVGFSMPYFGEPAALTGVVEPFPGWLLCNGAAVNVVDYPDLNTFLAGGYGTPGAGQFNLPDLRGRSGIGKKAGGSFATRGNTGGEETHTLTTGEMPVHTHLQDPHNHDQAPHNHPHNHFIADQGGTGQRLREHDTIQGGGGTLSVKRGGVTPTVDTGIDSTSATALNAAATAVNQNAGLGSPHNNMPPFLVIGGWIIKAKMI